MSKAKALKFLVAVLFVVGAAAAAFRRSGGSTIR